MANTLVANIPNAMIMKNQIPKSYFDFDIYNNLVQNNDDIQPYY